MRLTRPSALLASLTFLASSTFATAAPRAPRAEGRGPAPVVAEALPGTIAEPTPAVADLSLGDTAPTSHDVLVGRLTTIGAQADAIPGVLAQVDAARDDAGVLDGEAFGSAVTALGLDPSVAAKAVDLLRAYMIGAPVAFVGLEPDASEIAAVDRLTQQGLDPDAAAWAVLKSRGADPALMPSLLADLAGRLTSSAPARASLALSALRDAASVREGSGFRELPGLPQDDAAPVALAFCRSCPQFDAALVPTTAYKTQPGSLGAGDCKMYRFTVAAGRQYRFTFCEGGGTASFDTVLSAYGTQCTALGANDDSCGTRSQLDLATSAAGYIYVRVSHKTNGTGTFTLAYKDMGAAPVACKSCPQFDFGTYTPNANWQTHSSAISAGGCKVYRFQLALNRSYQFSLCSGGGTASFDTRLQTFYAGCQPGPSNDDACFPNLSEVSLTSGSNQYLYVRVSGQNGESGSYTLAYRDTTGQCQDCPNWNYGTFVPTTNWLSHSSSLAADSCVTYRFYVKADTSYTFSLCQGGGYSNFDSYLEGYGYDGSSCWYDAANDDECGWSSEIDVYPGYTGYYYVRLSSWGGGTYRLAYTQQCADSCTPQIGPFVPPYGTYAQTSSVVPDDGCRVTAFDLDAWTTYVFTFCTYDDWGNYAGGYADFDTGLYLYDAWCNYVTDNGDWCGSSSEIIYTPWYTGRHYLVTYDQGGYGGSYTLAYGAPAF